MAERSEPLWIVQEAWKQVRRATTAEDRARTLSTFRRSIATAAKHVGTPTPELTERLEQLENAAAELYVEQQDEHVRRAIRALGSLRMAVEARLAAGAGPDQVRVRVMGYGGRPIVEYDYGRDQTLSAFGIPAEFRHDRVVVQAHFNATPDVRVYRGRKIVWSNPGTPQARGPRRPIPAEEPPAG